MVHLSYCIHPRGEYNFAQILRAFNPKKGIVMARVVVLGASGFLGANLIRYLSSQPDIILTAADLKPHKPSADSAKIRFLTGDLQDPHFAIRCVSGQDIIFQCAAQSSHLRSMKYPYQDVESNILLSLRLLETVRHHNPEALVVYPSTTTVTGKLEGDFADESHPERPLDLYSAHKSLAEKYHFIYHHRYGLRAVVLRFSNLFGPLGHAGIEYNFINHFIHCALKNKPLKVFGAGDQIRNILFVEDAAALLWKATQHSDLMGGDVFLATGPYHHSIKEIAEAIVTVFGRGHIVHIPWPEKRLALEIGSAFFNSGKIREILGWAPVYNLREGLTRTRELIAEQNAEDAALFDYPRPLRL